MANARQLPLSTPNSGLRTQDSGLRTEECVVGATTVADRSRLAAVAPRSLCPPRRRDRAPDLLPGGRRAARCAPRPAGPQLEDPPLADRDGRSLARDRRQ